jgi:hypothetical protein
MMALIRCRVPQPGMETGAGRQVPEPNLYYAGLGNGEASLNVSPHDHLRFDFLCTITFCEEIDLQVGLIVAGFLSCKTASLLPRDTLSGPDRMATGSVRVT